MSGSYYNLYSLYMALQAQLNAISAGGGGVPTSSTLADVLLNGNSAGASNIDMNSNNIENVSVIDNAGNSITIGNGGADNIIVRATDSLTLVADGSLGGNVLLIEATNGDMSIEAVTGDINIDTPSGVVNINGSAYPPAVDDLSAVLTAGNTATNSITLNNSGTGTNVINLLPNASASNPQITLTDGTTTNTIDKNGYTTRNTTANLPHYLNFSDSSSTGTGSIQKTAGISCNPNTNTITATTFVGALTGTATNATNVAISYKNDNVTYPLCFTTTGAGNKPLYISNRSGVDSPTYNPLNNALIVNGNGAQGTFSAFLAKAENTNSQVSASVNYTGNITSIFNTQTYPPAPFLANSNLYLNNKNGTAGTQGVVTIVFDKTGRNVVAGDIIGSQNYYALNYAGTTTEFARVEASVRNTGAGNDDGSIAFSGLINGVMTEFFRVNGADSENNMFLPLDMNGQSIKSSSGNLAFSSTGSSGGGVIVMTSKTQSPSSQYDFSFLNSATNILAHSLSAGWDFFGRVITTSTGSLSLNASASSGTGTITLTPKVAGNLIFQNLPTAVAGLPSGAVWNNLGVLSIAP